MYFQNTYHQGRVLDRRILGHSSIASLSLPENDKHMYLYLSIHVVNWRIYFIVPGPLFTKRVGVLPHDLVKAWNRDSGLNFSYHF